MVAMPLRILPFLPPSTWVAPTYLQIDGTEYHLNSLEVKQKMVQQNGLSNGKKKVTFMPVGYAKKSLNPIVILE